MATLKLAGIRYEDALALLVLRKQALDSGALPRMTKQAMSQTHLLTKIGQNFEKKAIDAQLQNALVGAGLGAGLGGLGNLALGNKSKRKLNRFLEGGLTGASLGGGLGLLYGPLQEALSAKLKTEAPAVTEAAKSTAAIDPNINVVLQAAKQNPGDEALAATAKDLLKHQQRVQRHGGMDYALAGTSGGLAGAGGYQLGRRALNAIPVNKTQDEVTKEVINNLTSNLKTVTNDGSPVVDFNKIDQLGKYMKALSPNVAEAKINRLAKGILNSDVPSSALDKQMKNWSRLQRNRNLEANPLKIKGFRDAVQDALLTPAKGTTPEIPYSFKKPLVSKPGFGGTLGSGGVGALLGLAGEALFGDRDYDSLKQKAEDAARNLPGYTPPPPVTPPSNYRSSPI